MDITLYSFYFNSNDEDIKTYLMTKKLGRKSLKTKSNLYLAKILTSFILSKNPDKIYNKKEYVYGTSRYESIKSAIKYGIAIKHKNPYGVIIGISNTTTLCQCNKHVISYEYIFGRCSHYFCSQCLYQLMRLSTQYILEIATANMIKLFWSLRQTNIFLELNANVFNILFYNILILNK
jgi:hypothetical protein